MTASTEIALPDPQNVTLARIPEFLERSALVRIECAETKDIARAKALQRGLDAVIAYVADKEARQALKAERWRVEALIGKLSGPAQMGRNQHSEGSHDANPEDPELALIIEAAGIDKDELHRGRILAANEELMEQLIAEGVESRAEILRRISGEEFTPAVTSLQEGELRCPHCKRPVMLDSLLTE